MLFPWQLSARCLRWIFRRRKDIPVGLTAASLRPTRNINRRQRALNKCAFALSVSLTFAGIYRQNRRNRHRHLNVIKINNLRRNIGRTANLPVVIPYSFI